MGIPCLTSPWGKQGFRDDAYKRRRVAIADLAREHEV